MLIMLLIVLIMLAFESMSDAWSTNRELSQIQFRVQPDWTNSLSEQAALEQLKQSEWVEELHTSLQTHPFWVSILLPPIHYSDAVLLLQTRHLSNAHCWQVNSVGDRYEFWSTVEEPGYKRYRAGLWVLNLQEFGLKGQILCKLNFVGPAKFNVGLMPENLLLATDSMKSEKRRGFLEGSLILLISTMAVIALFGRSPLFMVYGLWLFFGLRMAMIFEGWDHEFFGMEIPLDFLPSQRKWVLSAYYLFTALLAVLLFDNLKRPQWRSMVRVVFGIAGLLIILAAVSSYSIFLQVYWPLSLVSMAVLFAAALQLVLERRKGLTLYFSLGLVIAFSGVVLELMDIWFQINWKVFILNSASMTLAASLMTATLLAERFRTVQDQRRVAKRSLSLVNQRLQRVFHMAPSAMFSVSPAGQLLNYNAKFQDEFLDAYQRPVYTFLEELNLQRLFRHIEPSQTPHRREVRLNKGEQSSRWFELILTRDESVLTGVIDDITLHKLRESELEYHANHDELTGALNRRGFQNLLSAQVDEEGNSEVIMYAIDIRRFARLTVVYGSPLAEKVLKACFQRLNSKLRSWGELARFGNDQFVLFIKPSHTEFQVIGQKGLSQDPFLGGNWCPPISIEGHLFQLEFQTCMLRMDQSFQVQDVFESIEEIFRRGHSSDRSIEPHGYFHVNSAQMQDFLEQTRIQRSLYLRQLPQNLAVLWQPILSLSNPYGELHAEALLRMRKPDGEYVLATELLHASVASGHSHYLDEWVMEEVLEFLHQNQSNLINLARINVNVSPHSLNNPQFVEKALHLLSKYSEVSGRLCLEITEMGMILNLEQVKAFIEKVRSFGTLIAIDDFGAGYSNFNYAVDLNCDVIKIDGALVQGLSRCPQNLAVVKAIVGLAHDLGCQCVAEWVENPETLKLVQALSIDYAQGYLISPALEPMRFLHQDSEAFLNIRQNLEGIHLAV
jgi:EAL domain-containing protein (putative c-di-GMP-specific phosphodiesterase class I)/GGDEF domain-containing protein